jgi:hypothetical protein
MHKNEVLNSDELTRRQFMINAARSYLGVSVVPMLGVGLAGSSWGASAGARAKAAEHVIFLNMSGGMSHLDTFDLKPGKKEVQGPVEGLSTGTDILISQYLPKTAKMAKHMCVINSMSSTQGAHEQGQYMLHRSYSPRGTITHPAIGAWVVRLKGRKNKTLPGFVSVGGSVKNASSGFMGAEYAGVPLGRPDQGLKNSKRASTVDEGDFHARLALADRLNQKFHERYKVPQVKAYESLYEEAVKLMKSEDLKAFDISLEPQANRAKYGKNNFGQGCLLARRLVEAGVRFVEVGLGGWDTHYDNFTAVEARCNVLDQGYAALLQDLESKGLLDSTLVVIGTEFGRSPGIVEEHNNGRDHHPACFSCVLAGGGVKGGTVYGKSDAKGARPKSDPVTVQDFNATIGYAIGVDHAKIIHSPSGRPFRMGGADAELGSPLKDVFV